ncbi:MAG: hypothetical protein D6813_01420 [Calditrichaeota bacterium]|nr:MAG: hypothetical protein D6813_01420 [Calditrichota bacterium]
MNFDPLSSEAKNLLTLTGVNGYGKGKKIKGGHRLDQDCITVTVEEKKPIDQISPSDVIPSTVDGIPTDVIAIGKLQPMAGEETFASTASEGNPILMGGVSIGAYYPTQTPAEQSWVGTLGGFFLDTFDNSLVLMTCYHICGMNIDGTYLSPAEDLTTTEILHPGGQCSDPLQTRIAQLRDYIKPVGADSPNNIGDVSICTVYRAPSEAGAREISMRPKNLNGNTSGMRTLDPVVGMPIITTGRTTDQTSGFVLVTDATVTVADATFYGQVICTHSIMPGDSGALVYTGSGDNISAIVGLMFAGSPPPQPPDPTTCVSYGVSSVFTPINTILEAFNNDTLRYGGQPHPFRTAAPLIVPTEEQLMAMLSAPSRIDPQSSKVVMKL